MSAPTPQRWLLLDFDNTLMETEKWVLPSLIARFNALYGEQIDHPLTLDEFETHFKGQGRQILCTNLSRHFNITVDWELLYENREWLVMQHLQSLPDGVLMAPHLIETLHRLTQQHYRFGFVSNNPIQRAMTAMRCAANQRGAELAQLLACYWFESGDKQKPLPDVYLRAMTQLATIPDHCIAVEDSLTGLQSALAAGLRVYAYGGFVADRDHHRATMLAAGATDWFADWADLPDLLPIA